MSANTGVLLLGANGQVGRELNLLLAAHAPVAALTSAELDLSRPADIRTVVRRIRPRAILNAAAYTAVDRAETDASAARAVNALAPGVLAEEAKRAGAVLIHYSTDFVFDGTKAGPYAEDDPANPLNVYGKTKHEGELAIEAVDVPSLIFRTSWVYGQHGKNFLLTMRRLLRSEDEVRVVDDQFGAPTWARSIAQSTLKVLTLAGDDCRGYIGQRRGLYHMTARGRTSWCGFAGQIARHLEANGEKVARVVGIPSSGYASPARRPPNSVLDNRKLTETFDFTLAHWRNMLVDCLGEAANTHPVQPS